jgi:hypothetical protein
MKSWLPDALLWMVVIGLFALGDYLWILLYRWHPWAP